MTPLNFARERLATSSTPKSGLKLAAVATTRLGPELAASDNGILTSAREGTVVSSNLPARSTHHTQDRAAPAGPAAARCGNCSIESRARARLICETIDSRIMDAFLKGLAAGMSKAAIIHPAVVFSLVLRFYNASGTDSSS